MKKLILVLLLIWFFFIPTNHATSGANPDSAIVNIGDLTIYVTRGNLLKPLFREPFEISVMIFPAYDYVTWSTHNDEAIYGNAWQRIEYLKSIGLRIEDAREIIHNHSLPGGFTPADRNFLRGLRANGYRGKYGIFFPFSNKVIYLDDEPKKEQK